MPQLKPLSVTVNSVASTYNVNGNSQGIASWLKSSTTLKGGQTLTLAKRPVKASQTTRKSNLTYTVPLETVCPTTCKTEWRGTVLSKLEFISSVDATDSERGDAYDSFVEMLKDVDVRDAIVNNESFWS